MTGLRSLLGLVVVAVPLAVSSTQAASDHAGNALVRDVTIGWQQIREDFGNWVASLEREVVARAAKRRANDRIRRGQLALEFWDLYTSPSLRAISHTANIPLVECGDGKWHRHGTLEHNVVILRHMLEHGLITCKDDLSYAWFAHRVCPPSN